jgi:anaerobic magnesium-protoporphyrin IX monomethyl ester cyclase
VLIVKFILLNPPFFAKYSRFSRSPAVTKSGTIYFPIWHAYAAGVLEKAGHEVKLIDAPADSLSREDCYKIIKEFRTDICVLYTSTPSIYNDIEIGAHIKNLLPDCFVVLTGPHVSALPEETLKLDNRIDAIARKEYDFTLVDLASALSSGRELTDVTGITFRKDKDIISTPDRPFIEDLDSIPFVSEIYKRHLNIKNYFYAHCRYPVISIFSSRGCNGACNYCVYPQQMFGRKRRQRSPENIVAEFQYIEKELPQVKEVLIDDDNFSFEQEHTLRFCELMIKNNIKIPWTVECRASLKYETMVMMKKAGCRLIVVGFESADDVVLKNMKKGMTYERMKNFVKDAKKAKIMIHSCFMAGNMGETKDTLMKSLQFAKEINADTCQFFPLMVYPGTEAYEWADKNKFLATKDFSKWLTKDGLHNCVINTPDLSSDDLVNFCDYARKKYYLSAGYLRYKIWQAIIKPEEGIKTLKSAKTFFKYLFKHTNKKQLC